MRGIESRTVTIVVAYLVALSFSQTLEHVNYRHKYTEGSACIALYRKSVDRKYIEQYAVQMALPIRSRLSASDPNASYDDTGAIAVTDTTHRPNSVAYKVSLCGVSGVKELSETQPAFHKAFGKLPGFFCTRIISQRINRAASPSRKAFGHF